MSKMVAIAIVMVVSCGCLDQIKTYGQCMVEAPSLAPGGARQNNVKKTSFFLVPHVIYLS